MGKFVKGDVVIIPFPFSDLTGNKKRPAFVVADLSVTGKLSEIKIRYAVNSIINIISS